MSAWVGCCGVVGLHIQVFISKHAAPICGCLPSRSSICKYYCCRHVGTRPSPLFPQPVMIRSSSSFCTALALKFLWKCLGPDRLNLARDPTLNHSSLVCIWWYTSKAYPPILMHYSRRALRTYLNVAIAQAHLQSDLCTEISEGSQGIHQAKKLKGIVIMLLAKASWHEALARRLANQYRSTARSVLRDKIWEESLAQTERLYTPDFFDKYCHTLSRVSGGRGEWA
jgi:hypothetical protein